MRFGVLGSGSVGQAIAGKLATLGHEVKMGARKAGGEKAAAFVAKAGKSASEGTFADAAAFGEILFHCTKGETALEALRAAGAANLNGKIVVDVSNPLDFSKGMPPRLFTPPGDSLGEMIQREFPAARVVKALNTVNADLMGAPGKLPGETDLFICGNDDASKKQVSSLLSTFGWKTIHDVGDISNARGTEAYLLLWIELYGRWKTGAFNVRIVK
jgi:8-hydroxy-5-deazaflavin:NADPH oxidoreductase